MQTKKYQHYVPQFYLRGFFDPAEEAKGQHTLWLYRSGYQPLRVPTKKIGGEEFFYNYEADDGADQTWIEDRLSELERYTAPTLRKLASGDLYLTSKERSEFAGFLALTFCRGRFFADLANKLSNDAHLDIVRSLLESPATFDQALKIYEQQTGERLDTTFEAMQEFMQKVVKGEFVPEQTSKGWTMKMMFVQMLEMMPVFEAMQWALLQASPDALFLTSDRPVYVYDPGMRPPTDGKLVYSEDASFSFPLTREYALQGTFPSRPDIQLRLTPYKVRQFNRMTIAHSYQYLYAPMQSAAIQDLMEKIYRLRPPVLPDLPDELRIKINS